MEKLDLNSSVISSKPKAKSLSCTCSIRTYNTYRRITQRSGGNMRTTRKKPPQNGRAPVYISIRFKYIGERNQWVVLVVTCLIQKLRVSEKENMKLIIPS